MSRAWLDLGSNLERDTSLRRALQLLGQHVVVVRTSSVYESAPVGFADQPNFYNMCVEISTDLLPDELRPLLRSLEDEMGRVRGSNKYGPRNIDMDLVLHEVLQDEKLPHPQVAREAFVLLPLCELIPDFVHPLSGLTLQQMLQDLGVAPGTLKKVDLK